MRLISSNLTSERKRAVRRRVARALLCGVIVAVGGCRQLEKIPDGPHDHTPSYHDNVGLEIEYPQVAECATSPQLAAKSATEPLALEDPSKIPAYELSLEQAIQLAVQQSPVLRSIGGAIVSSPQSARTVYDPSVTASSVNQGTEAALSAFDAQYTQQLFWNNVDQPTNRQPFTIAGVGGGPPLVFAPFSQSQNATFTNELSKQTATGARFALRHNVLYNRTQDPSVAQLLFPSVFSGSIEAEWRQPLLQGSGTTYNRIAGPSNVPGVYNGVLIARINEDVSLADFEAAVIQLAADVEQAYWDLATAYRILDANIKGREAAQQTFQFQQVRLEVGSGRSDEEAQARSQFYQFQAQVESSLGGTAGLYALEQRLRYLIGMAASDGRLIRPTTNPTDAKVVFDWESALGQALDRRVEVRRQRFSVKRRELEVIASKLNLRPRLDFLAQYRWRGLGNHLIGDTDKSQFDNLYKTITDGDYQEGQAGFELSFPVGLRLASLAVREARLNLQRERAILDETELRVSHDLSDATRQIALTYQLLETNYNRYQADLRQVDVLRRRYRDGNDNINFLLQAQRQVVTSESEFYRSLFAYNLAIRDIHRQKGSLLAYNQVQLAEGPWAAGAAADANTVGRFLEPRLDPSAVSVPAPLTSGPFMPSAVQNTNPAISASTSGQIIGDVTQQAVAPSYATVSEADGVDPVIVEPFRNSAAREAEAFSDSP
ncbi:putative outer membrane efflux protein MdtP [Rubripirellula tenax]|uniref:Putative outer membrane efflux protein MdtP n=1 Tax=Rubripirellula tenax TaxID=2528015 RepID=A0A5C6F344_9BACT|nr:TolC family protein [Rubripirellula tenax]TWU54466.1 putative outer membrane efflux protein MdtP [Rubripirellula tenax]